MPGPEKVSSSLRELAGVDRIVHEPARLLVLAVLAAVEEADFLFVQGQTGLTFGNLSSHLARLEEAGYIAVRKEFVARKPRTFLRLTDPGRDALAAWRSTISRVIGGLPGSS